MAHVLQQQGAKSVGGEGITHNCIQGTHMIHIRGWCHLGAGLHIHPLFPLLMVRYLIFHAASA